MKKTSAILVLIAASLSGLAQMRKILIVSTNRDSVGTHVSGTFLKEIAYPFQYFTDQDWEVDIVTPNGGKAAVYHWGTTPDDLDKIRKSELFIKKTNETLTPDQVTPQGYSAVFYPGGHGQYFDVINDERIANLTARIYESGGVIGTAGHGAASLINIKLANGKYLVDGKTMTCFPHWAEVAFMNISNFGKLLPFDMEAVLARRGANLIICTKETRSNDQFTLVADAENRMVTGAFASSAKWVAEKMSTLILNSEPQSAKEEDAILTIISDYVEGRNAGDIARLTSAFHPTATLKGLDTKTHEPSTTPLSEYLGRNKSGKKHDCTSQIHLLHHVNDIAIGHVTLTYSSHVYNDYLVLMKVNGGWKITEKVYTKIDLKSQAIR